jgi:hypothetical protein
MLQTDPVADTAQSKGRSDEVSELSPAVQCGGIKDNVVVNVLLVDVGADHKGMLALGKSQRKLLPDAVRLLRRDLTRQKACRVW